LRGDLSSPVFYVNLHGVKANKHKRILLITATPQTQTFLIEVYKTKLYWNKNILIKLRLFHFTFSFPVGAVHKRDRLIGGVQVE
jgi:hypothetical protein